MKFIDYFKQAIRKQFMREKAKDELVKKLGMLNANPKCKKLLLALPPEPEPTLIQMIEACNFLGIRILGYPASSGYGPRSDRSFGSNANHIQETTTTRSGPMPPVQGTTTL